MYKVLIVDDESYVIKSLIASIDWQAHGFEIAGQASNGIEALELIEQDQPDLVFTDVKMPGMGGLELIKTAVDRALPAIFVVISGYAEFAYAQKAMNYGAFGYCLKPFEDSEITSILTKAKAKLDGGLHASQPDLLELLEDRSEECVARVKGIFRSAGLPGKEDSKFLVLVAIGGQSFQLPRPIPSLQLKIGTHKYGCLVEYDQLDRVRAHIGRMLPDAVRSIGICTLPVPIAMIKQALEVALVAAHQFFVMGTRGAYESGSLSQNEWNSTIVQLEQAIDGKAAHAIRKVLEQISPSADRLDIRHALRIYNMVMSFVYRINHTHYEDYVYSYDQLINLFERFPNMLAYLQDQLAKPALAGQAAPAQDIRNETFRSILHYVNEHYCSDITIQSLSQTFRINPNYISQLFKKELDTPFTVYLTNMRMSFACGLLRTTNLTVNEIAERSGYEEYYYFTRVFKKSIGKTPTEYRNG
ncbi:response regulator [Paenibacillus silvisoli]|uniref:response regulator n=1 Tax=Paenibacillus silvisoli TaxID=3110539 RepID=UPI0028055250|nr:response regulator [Paenibacillus silvisoli]